MIARKIIKNYWLVLSLFIGILVTITLVASIPIYTTGSLQNLVLSDSQRYQENHGTYPGIITHELNWRELQPQLDRVEILEQIVEANENVLRRQIDMPRVNSGIMLTSSGLQGERASSDSTLRNVFLRSLSGFEDHITLVQGREPEHSGTPDVFEVYVHDRALVDMDIFLGEEIRLKHRSMNEDIIVRPVGTFQAKEQTELFWPEPPETLEGMFILADDVFQEHLLPLDHFVEKVLIYSTYDYTRLDISDAYKLLPIQRMLRTESIRATESTDVSISSPMIKIVHYFLHQEGQFRMMTISFFIPILTMLLIYLFMISNLIVERQQAEIAVLRSRGAGKRQISFIYLVETLLLCGLALLIGPFLGLLMSKMVGSTLVLWNLSNAKLYLPNSH